MAMTGLQRPQAQALLGRSLFSGWDEHEKPVTALSGGERRRLSLAVVVASGANLLVLDEPTNHLDLESREALEAALEAFPGTVLLVSHDRAVLDATAERTVAIEGRLLRSYDGGWADLVRARSEAEEAAEPEPKPERPARPARPPKPRPERRSPTELERVEAGIATLERQVGELEAKLAADWTNMDVLTAHRAARDELQQLLGRWEELFEAAQAAEPGGP
jgi:ATP-binding cassette subfamily F protein 3